MQVTRTADDEFDGGLIVAHLIAQNDADSFEHTAVFEEVHDVSVWGPQHDQGPADEETQRTDPFGVVFLTVLVFEYSFALQPK